MVVQSEERQRLNMKKYAEGGELPQAMVDRMKRKENEEDRELVMGPVRAGVKAGKAVAEKLKKDLTGGAATGARLNMGKLPGKAAAEKLGMQDATDIEKRNAAAYLRKGYSDDDAKDMAKQKAMKKGGMVKSSASKRADGCAQRGKTRGRMV
jgi:hypothetical protein